MVVADRFLFTGLARDAARGLDLDWVLHAYSPLFWPDIVFNFSVSLDTSTSRVAANRTPKFYDAGQDVTNITDPISSYRAFESRVIREYENLSVIFRSGHRRRRAADLRTAQAAFAACSRRAGATDWGEWNVEALTEWLDAAGPDPEVGRER